MSSSIDQDQPKAVHNPNPLHQDSEANTAWTTVNAAENIPGVLTPLGFDFWMNAVDLGLRGGFHRLGVLPVSAVQVGATSQDRLSGIFYGRLAFNVDQFRRLADLTPGVSGAAFERNLFGSSRTDFPVARNWIRYPIVLAKGPIVVTRLPRTVADATVEFRVWWRRFTAESEGHRPAAVRLREAHSRMVEGLVLQTLSSTLAQGLFERLGELAAGAGRGDLHLRLCAGYGDMEESRMVAALYGIAHHPDRPGNTIEEFLAAYGARCDGENEISAHSWRERPERITKLIEKYRQASPRQDPSEHQADRAADRQAAEHELLAELSVWRRPLARLLMGLARRYTPLREEAKHLMAMSMDAGRCAARARGRELVAAGVIDDQEDVFLLTLTEMLGEPPPDARALVTGRRALREMYADHGIPQYWVGNPQPVMEARQPASSDHLRADEVAGIPGAFGIAEGIARVVLNAEDCDDIEPDEVLICRATDPSWASAFHLVSAVVIDIGGASSHGAIVCRELGLPCVINTVTGTRTIRTGDRVHVDGAAGTVTILERG